MNMDKIYGLMLQGYNITHELLLSKGYSEETINNMVKKNLLVLEDGFYYANDVNNVYNYYKAHVRELNLDQQAFLLDTVIYLKPTHVGALFQKFYVSLKLGDNVGALNAFAAEYGIQKSNMYKNDSKLQLLLLSKLINVGPELYQEICNLTIDDIKISKSDNRYTNIELHNKAREEILKGNYEKALNMLFNNGNSCKITFQELVFKTLLNRIVHSYANGRNYKECILDGRYGDALYSINLRNDLTDYEELVKYLLEFLINPPEQIYVDYNHEPGLWESVRANDFENALFLNRQYNHDKGIDENDSSLNIVLKEIIDMLASFTRIEETDEVEPVVEPIVEQTIEPVVEPIVEQTIEPVVEEKVEESTNEEDIIDKISFISELINQGLSFEDALFHASYDDHTNGYITLIYAKEAYRTGNIKTGDKLMSMYNHSQNKDKDNNTFYKRINESKKFLPFRDPELSIDITVPKKLSRSK